MYVNYRSMTIYLYIHVNHLNIYFSTLYVCTLSEQLGQIRQGVRKGKIINKKFPTKFCSIKNTKNMLQICKTFNTYLEYRFILFVYIYVHIMYIVIYVILKLYVYVPLGSNG